MFVLRPRLPFERFAQESDTRWNGSLLHLESHLTNSTVIRNCFKGPPAAFSDAQLKTIQHLCGVMTPILLATKALEGEAEGVLGSCYEPMARAVIAHCAPDAKTPKPAGGASFGSRWPNNRKEKYVVGELEPLAARLKAFLKRDQEFALKKHLEKSTGLKWVRMASFLDPRHKDLTWLNDEERAEVIKNVKVEAGRHVNSLTV